MLGVAWSVGPPTQYDSRGAINLLLCQRQETRGPKHSSELNLHESLHKGLSGRLLACQQFSQVSPAKKEVIHASQHAK